MSEHCFISWDAFAPSHVAAAGQKCRSSKAWNCCKFHAERQVGGGRGAQSLLLSGEEAVVNSPSIKSP